MAKDEEKKEGEGAGAKLIGAALTAFGIDPKYVLGSAFNKATGEAVVVTQGGKKVRFKAGDKVVPLDSIAVTGINPKPKRKPITGEAKK